MSETVERAKLSIEKAHQMVSDLCHQKRQWVMSIPAQPDYDPDLVIGQALRDATSAIDELASVVQPALLDAAATEKTASELLPEEVMVLVEIAKNIVDKPLRLQDMMRREGFVIDNLEDRMQKLAFTFYTEICGLSTQCKNILEEINERATTE